LPDRARLQPCIRNYSKPFAINCLLPWALVRCNQYRIASAFAWNTNFRDTPGHHAWKLSPFKLPIFTDESNHRKLPKACRHNHSCFAKNRLYNCAWDFGKVRLTQYFVKLDGKWQSRYRVSQVAYQQRLLIRRMQRVEVFQVWTTQIKNTLRLLKILPMENRLSAALQSPNQFMPLDLSWSPVIVDRKRQRPMGWGKYSQPKIAATDRKRCFHNALRFHFNSNKFVCIMRFH